MSTPALALQRQLQTNFPGSPASLQPLAEVSGQAVVELKAILEPNVEVRPGPVPDCEVPHEVKVCLKAWLAFLSHQTGNNRGVIYLTPIKRKRSLEIRLRLFETESITNLEAPTIPAWFSDSDLELLDFRLTSKFPETLVTLKLTLNSPLQ